MTGGEGLLGRSISENFFLPGIILTVESGPQPQQADGDSLNLLNPMLDGSLPGNRHVAQDGDPFGERRMRAE